MPQLALQQMPLLPPQLLPAQLLPQPQQFHHHRGSFRRQWRSSRQPWQHNRPPSLRPRRPWLRSRTASRRWKQGWQLRRPRTGSWKDPWLRNKPPSLCTRHPWLSSRTASGRWKQGWQLWRTRTRGWKEWCKTCSERCQIPCMQQPWLGYGRAAVMSGTGRLAGAAAAPGMKAPEGVTNWQIMILRRSSAGQLEIVGEFHGGWLWPLRWRPFLESLVPKAPTPTRNQCWAA